MSPVWIWTISGPWWELPTTLEYEVDEDFPCPDCDRFWSKGQTACECGLTIEEVAERLARRG